MRGSRLAALLAAGLFFFPAEGGAAPRLLVVVSVDQMRADYLDRFSVSKSSGFRVLYTQGAVWTDAHHRHVPTETGPGHAVILTGRYPGRTGVVGNDWWDRRASTEVYVVRDSVHGMGPENLLVYTLGDVLKAKTPASRVVSISMKDRAAILMGGKKADIAVWYDKKKGRFVTSSYYGAAPRWLSEFNAKLKAPVDTATPEADRLLLELAETVMGEYRLGQGPQTDLLAVGFSATDYIGHAYGPESPQMDRQLASLDAVLGELIGFSRIQSESVDLALTADHAVMPVPEGETGRGMKARRIKEDRFEAGLEKVLQALHPAKGKRWITGVYVPNLYLNRALARELDLDWPAFLRDAARTLLQADGVDKVYVPGEWELSDPFVSAYRRSYHAERSGDLMLRTSHAVLVSSLKASHGSPYGYDTHVPLIFWGPDFKTGLFGSPASVADLAPTCAAALGLSFPPAASEEDGGHRLDGALVH